MGEGEGCARTWVRLPSHPHIYRGKGEGGRAPQSQSEEGAAAKGVALPPKARGRPPFRVPPNPRRMGPRGEAPSPLRPYPHTTHRALRGRWTLLVDPRNPFGGPSTIPVNP